MKITVSTTYDIIGLIKGYEDYGVTKCGKVINLKRCKIVKKTFSGMSKGWYLNSKFVHDIELTELKKECPF